SPIGIADYWIWKFANQLDDDYASWQHVRSTGSLLAGEGFTMKGPGTGTILTDQNYVFNGKPNNGDINLSLSAGNDYLVGNPYASAIDAEQFILDNGATISGAGATTGTLYFWEHWGGGSHILQEYQGGYGTYTLAGGIPSASQGTNDPDVGTGGTPTKTPGRYIPVGQGFFVVAETTGTINFNNGQRVFQKEGGTSTFMRSAKQNANNNTESTQDMRMKIRIGFNSVNTIHRQLLLTIDENTTAGVDPGYDGKLNEGQIDDLYWMIGVEKYSIQSVDIVDTESVFPLGIHTNIDGLNNIAIDALENVPANLEILVHDKVLNIYHDLRVSNYEFFLLFGEYLDRFEIVFNNTTFSDTDNEFDSLDTHFSNALESIIIINPTLKNIKSVELVNILGQSVYSIQDIPNINYSEFKTNNISSGTYIIKLETETGTLTKKVLVE
ncbi:MAG: MAM protein, partial [Bacteroidetes bacterium]